MNDKIEKQEEYFDLPALNSEGWLSLNDLPGEEWKPIMGYEESYMVSSCGRVKSLDRYVTSKRGYTKFVKGRILRESMSSYGYAVVGIKGKQSGVHRLVAKSFIPNPNGLTEINHKDENKTNNVVYNLEWCDKIYNNQYGTRVKRIKEAQLNDPKKSRPVLCYTRDNKLVCEYPSMAEANRRTGISEHSIFSVCNKKPHCFTAGGYKWKYVSDETPINKFPIPKLDIRVRAVAMYNEKGDEIASFKNAKAARRATNIHDTSILRCCRGVRGVKSAGGYIWRFKE